MIRRFTSLTVVLAVLALPASASTAADRSPTDQPAPTFAPDRIYGGAPHDKADSVVVLGADGTLEGRFQDAMGDPDWQGWTPVDNTASDNHWNVSTYLAQQLDPSQDVNYAWWCGTTFANACTEGYGHNWDTSLSWAGTIPQPSYTYEIKVNATANIHILDVGFDVLSLQAELAGQGWVTMATFDGTGLPLAISETFFMQTDEYTGPGSDQVRLRWRFTSDNAWDDQDCLLDSTGPVMLDNIAVWVRRSGSPNFVRIGTIETCQPGDPLTWTPGGSGGVGNFGQVWTGLDDIDPCGQNSSPQVAFIDDGLVVPGTGGTSCLTWCYGPDSNVVNPEGGLAGPDRYLDAMVVSPVITWPGDQYDGGLLEFDVYRHLLLEAGASGIAYAWHVRSVGSLDDITQAEWVNDNGVHFGVPDYYHRFTVDISELLVPQAAEVQIALQVIEIGHLWGLNGLDATPAPYFDNVRLTAFEISGPRLYARESKQAQDAFPAQGFVNLDNLASNSVRFDAALNVSLDPWVIVRGDSVVVHVDGASPPLQGDVTLHYKLIPNPLFDPVRTAIPPGSGNTAFEGRVVCAEPPPPYADGKTYFADLPDAGFFFPGDEIHYYFRAIDTDMRAGTVPADTSGFGRRPTGPVGLDDHYDPLFTVRALPTALSTTAGDQPKVLLWDDSGDDEELDAWLRALTGLPLVQGTGFDLFRTRSPASGISNGLGGMFPYSSLLGYETILYSSGDETRNTLTGVEEDGDRGDDVGMLLFWLFEPDRTLVLMGDNLASSMEADGHPDVANFLGTTMGVDALGVDVRPDIDMQVAPTVWPVPGDPIFDDAGWLADGGCPVYNSFDHIVPVGPGVRSAEFLDPGGIAGAYTAAAAVTAPFNPATSSSDVITLPYAMTTLDEIQQLPKHARGDKWFFPPGPLSFLHDILDHSGIPISSVAPDVFDLSLAAHPNPFNPRTTIAYTVDREGPVTVDMFDLRGRLVKRLVDEVRPAGAWTAEWDGRDDRGHGVSSGVYFCIMQADSGRRAMKVTLLR